MVADETKIHPTLSAASGVIQVNHASEKLAELTAASLIHAEVVMISGCRNQECSAEMNVDKFSLPDVAGKNGGACTASVIKGLLRHSLR